MIFDYNKLEDEAFLHVWGTMRKFKIQYFIESIYKSWGVLLFFLIFKSPFNSYIPISIREIGIGMIVFTMTGIVMANIYFKKNEKRFHSSLGSNTRVF